MLINTLSKKTGVSIHTLRYYESRGLIKGQCREGVTTNNYKTYPEDAIEVIEFINEAKEVGFTLSEIKNLLDSWTNNRLSPEKKKAVIAAKIEEVELKIKQLKLVKKKLQVVLKEVEEGYC
ncbi:MerR family transcriptional regulator [Gynurincola endophyticus]|uniref:MerR family transcriptional regulator n=1 Tax=Gynurincola endophyticus TaxID=2479004 RepID=UPI000F8D9544|nr:MerR family transcriptional regulator [Gynurincola endophyticus]